MIPTSIRERYAGKTAGLNFCGQPISELPRDELEMVLAYAFDWMTAAEEKEHELSLELIHTLAAVAKEVNCG